MKLKIIASTIGFAALIIWTGCTSKKEVIDYPTLPTAPTCDTTNVKYSVEITAILTTNCYGCHARASNPDQFNTYATLRPYATSGLLVNVVAHTPGYDPMPKGGSKLSDCDIAKIRTWVRNGAPNN